MGTLIDSRGSNGQLPLRQSPGTRIAAAALLILTAGLFAIGCSDTGNPDPVSYPGFWEGYLGFADNNSGITTLEIENDLSCRATGVLNGTILAWGEFEIRFEGDVTIRVDETLLGPITVTRIRPGIDTLQAQGIMSGEFNLRLAQCLGAWTTNPGGPFGIQGSWGARKHE
jgi:hypothetical protein